MGKMTLKIDDVLYRIIELDVDLTENFLNQFLRKIHKTRKELFLELLGLKPPNINIKIGTNFEQSYRFKSGYMFNLELTTRDIKHEVVHEIHYAANKSLRKWVLWKIYLGKKQVRDSRFEDAEGILDQLLGLEVEGLATYVSGTPSEKLFSKHVKKFKEMAEGYYPTVVYLLEDFNPLYPMGYHMCKTIEMAGLDPIQVGFGTTPFQFLKIYEQSCGKIHSKPVISTKYMSRIYGNLFKR